MEDENLEVEEEDSVDIEKKMLAEAIVDLKITGEFSCIT